MIKIIRPLVCFMFFIMFVTLYNQTYNEKSLTYKNIVALPVNYSPLEFGCKAHRSGATCFIMDDYTTLPALEIWKDIPGFNGYYQASNYGQIKSVLRHVTTPKGFKTKRGGFVKKLTLGNNGYLVVNLMDRSYLVHRLIGITFIPNPEKKRTINHKNGITTDNVVANIEWATDSENHIHAYKYLNRKSAQTGVFNQESTSKRIYQININSGELINEFLSGHEAARYFKLGHTFSAGISRCATKLTDSYMGYKWMFNYEKQV